MASSLLLVTISIATLLPWSCTARSIVDVPAIFVFGDSLADVGNNNNLNSSRANFPHNGVDFPGGVPTGRFSNGYNNIDWIAKFIGYKQSPPSYLSLANGTNLLQGVNFASGGSGILDTTGKTITFTVQIANFKSIVDVLVKQMDEERAARILSKALFLISAGSNDIFPYYLASGAQNSSQNQQFITSLVDEFSDHLKTLYKYGARKFGITGIPHIGCIPLIKSLSRAGECNEILNRLARKFNTAAKSRMHDLQSMLPGMKYSYGNVYDLMTLAIANPQVFGYKDVVGACCGSGKFNGAGPCIPNATLCSNRNQYLFWDQFHPTQATSRFLALKFYSGSRKFATPINVKSLIKC